MLIEILSFNYCTLSKLFFSVAAAIVFDLTRPETFRSVEKVITK
jgi:hypothetical protein